MTAIISRKTKARAKVEQILQRTAAPLTLEVLHQRLKRSLPKTAFSTVFRIMQRLEAEQLVTKSTWKDRGAVYEWAKRPHHHHVVCERCDAVADIDDRLIGYNEHKLTLSTGFTITHHTVELIGVCQPCQNK
ncbi:MAG: transcriptional repressor [Candidatus Buchananbacteria bacterium]|nr:transcriptional repressor [Candidatus Buchananbacteria bacterium]